MKHQTLKSGILLALILAVALPTLAQPQRGFKGPGNGPQSICDELNLTEQQEQAMQELRYDRESVMIDLRAERQSERLKLRKLRQADEPNKKKLYAQVEKVGAVQIKIDKSRVDHGLAVRKVLTKDQFKIYSQSRQHQFGQREGRRGEMRGMHNNRPRRNRF